MHLLPTPYKSLFNLATIYLSTLNSKLFVLRNLVRISLFKKVYLFHLLFLFLGVSYFLVCTNKTYKTCKFKIKWKPIDPPLSKTKMFPIPLPSLRVFCPIMFPSFPWGTSPDPNNTMNCFHCLGFILILPTMYLPFTQHIV